MADSAPPSKKLKKASAEVGTSKTKTTNDFLKEVADGRQKVSNN